MRTNSKRLMSLVMVVGLVAAACGGDDDDAALDDDTSTEAESTAGSGSATTSGGESDTTSTTGDETASEDSDASSEAGSESTDSPEGGPTSDAVLRVAIRNPAVTFDPHQAPTTVDEDGLNVFYDKLFEQTAEGVPEPELVESFEYTDEGIVLSLRDGVVFQDGTAFDADAVKANVERGQSLEESTVVGDLAPITAVEVIDPLTVLLATDSVNVTLPAVLTGRAGMMVSPAAFDSDLAMTPVGAGPFRVVSHNVGVETVAERWDGYWNPESVDVAELELIYLTDAAARLNALRTGQVDAAEIESAQIADAEAADLKVVETLSQAVIAVQISPDTVPAWADERVRQAVNHAIDRQAIVDGVLLGNGEPSFQFFGPASSANDPELEEPYPYDPEAAKALLADAGYPDGFEFAVLRGTTPSLTELEALAGFLADVGIAMNIRQIQGAEGVQLMWTEKTGEALAFPSGTFFDPALNLGNFLPDNFRNPANQTSDVVTSLYEQSITEQDPAARQEINREISRELAVHPLGMLPLHSQSVAWAMTQDVDGLEYLPTTRYVFNNVSVAD